MGEIPSTMDLIMERTRGMALSAEEKETLRKEELQKKARGFRLRLLENPSRVKEILAAVENEPPENRGTLSSMIWETMIDGMIDHPEPIKVLQVLERLPQANKKTALLERFRSAVNGAIRQKSKDHKRLIEKERRKLASQGISGSAVVPRVPRDSYTRAAVDEALAKYRDRLVRDA